MWFVLSPLFEKYEMTMDTEINFDDFGYGLSMFEAYFDAFPHDIWTEKMDAYFADEAANE